MYYEILMQRNLIQIRVRSQGTDGGFEEYDADFTTLNAAAIYLRGLHLVYPGIGVAAHNRGLVMALLEMEKPE